MIDTVSLRIPMEWDDPITGGFFASYDAFGELTYSTTKTLHLVGSHDGKVAIRTVERGWVELSGSFAKFLQGHNLFGSDDLPALARETLWRVLWLVGQARTRREVWDAIDQAVVSRVDLTYSYRLDTARDVGLWLDRASELSSMRYRGRPTLVGSTLYFGKANEGKRASPWQLKIYNKGYEVKAHQLPKTLSRLDELLEWADGILRVELTLRSQELKRIAERSDYRLPVRVCGEWTPEIVGELFDRYFEKMELGDMAVPTNEVLDVLPARLLGVYHVWREGYSIQERYSPTTAKRYRRQLLDALSVDIFRPADHGKGVIAAFPMKARVLRPNRAPDPTWADEVMFVPLLAA